MGGNLPGGRTIYPLKSRAGRNISRFFSKEVKLGLCLIDLSGEERSWRKVNLNRKESNLIEGWMFFASFQGPGRKWRNLDKQIKRFWVKSEICDRLDRLLQFRSLEGL